MRLVVLVAAAAVALAFAGPAEAAPGVRFGIHDDAWLVYGPGTLEQRLDRLDRLGVDVVRFTLRWDAIAEKRPKDAVDPDDPAYEWKLVDPVLRGLRAHRIDLVLTLLGTPGWANGDRVWQWVPTHGSDFANFATAAASRYHWVRRWLVWNEPNQRRWLRPTSPRVYVERLLAPAYAALHDEVSGVQVAGGVTAPRGNAGGVSPVRWIRGMAAAGAELDAYAHHPYPLNPRVDSPNGGGCRWWRCETITMGTLERLIGEVRAAWGPKRIWLTEYAYQTNPPERTILGVSPALQARYIGEAALRAYRAPQVDMLIHFLVQDDVVPAAWQSGLYTVKGKPKLSARAFPLPLAQAWRKGASVRLWGEVRPRAGTQTFRLRVLRHGRWGWLGGVRRTNARGIFWVTARLPPGAQIQLYSPRDRLASPALTLR